MITIIQGEDKNIYVKIEESNGDAYNLSSLTEVEACFKKSDGTNLVKKMTEGAVSIVDAAPQNGKLKVRLEEDETAELKKGAEQDIEILLDESGEKNILQFLGELTVLARVCG